jgi:hypothetical protein
MELDEAQTGLGYMLEAHKIGGPYMKVISILAILMIVILIWKAWEVFGKKHADYKLLDLILMAGSLAAATGIFSQIVGIVQALEAIRAAADISPEIVMGGAIVSFYAPIWGFMVFIFSLLFYFILKEIIKARKSE